MADGKTAFTKILGIYTILATLYAKNPVAGCRWPPAAGKAVEP